MNDAAAAELPFYDWQRATIGDEADAVVVEITAARLAAYAQAHHEAPGASGHTLPPVMIRLYAPLRRRELVARMGARYPAHPTPAVRWQCDIRGLLRVGDRVRSITRVADKFMKNGRHFIRWEVSAWREGDEQPVALFGYVNLWDTGRPEDQQRARSAPPAMTDRPPAQGSWTASMEDILSFGDFLYPARPDNPNRAGNPHIDIEYARKHIYGGITVDGNQTVDHLCRLATDLLPPGSVGAPGTQISIAFPNPCREGDLVSLSAVPASPPPHDGPARQALKLQAHNQAGHCLASGSITVQLPAAGASSSRSEGSP